MGMVAIAEDAWLLALGNANGVLLRYGDELTLIDAGFPRKEQVVFAAIAALGKQPSDLKHLVFTHGHPDHVGSGAAIVRAFEDEAEGRRSQRRLCDLKFAAVAFGHGKALTCDALARLHRAAGRRA